MGFKLNNPGCNCCGGGGEPVVCPIECYNTSTSTWQEASSNTIQFDITPPATIYQYAGTTFPGLVEEVLGLDAFAGVYQFTLFENEFGDCAVPTEIDIEDFSAITVNRYGYNFCSGGGPFTTTNIPLTRMTYSPASTVGTLAADSHRVFGIVFTFFSGTPPVAFSGVAFFTTGTFIPSCIDGDVRLNVVPVTNSFSVCPAYFTANSVVGTYEFVV